MFPHLSSESFCSIGKAEYHHLLMLCRLKWIYKNIDELMHAVCFADELERFEQAAFECIEFLFGPVSRFTLLSILSHLLSDRTVTPT